MLYQKQTADFGFMKIKWTFVAAKFNHKAGNTE